MADNDATATIAARRADLREMLNHNLDHFEGIDKDDALRELLDLLDQEDDSCRVGNCFRCGMPVEEIDTRIAVDISGRDDCPESADGLPHEIDEPS